MVSVEKTGEIKISSVLWLIVLYQSFLDLIYIPLLHKILTQRETE